MCAGEIKAMFISKLSLICCIYIYVYTYFIKETLENLRSMRVTNLVAETPAQIPAEIPDS